MKVTLGIDPGMTGAIAMIGPDPGTATVWDMPVVTDGKTKRVNAMAVAELLRSITCTHTIEEIRIEKVNAMPPRPGKNGQQRSVGSQSMFNFGRGVGVLDGVCGALSIRTRYVTPQKWKKRADLIGKDKDEARTRALELYPHLELHRKKDVGRADAILIAHYGEE